MRLIDADALIDRMYHDAFETDTDMQKWDSGCWIRYKMFENAIDDAPTIDAVEVEWIPCSERMPKDSGDYLVRFSDEYIEDHSSLDVAEIEIERFDADCESFGYWVDRYDPVSLGFVDSDWVELPIIAWMPLPKPYGERKESE